MRPRGARGPARRKALARRRASWLRSAMPKSATDVMQEILVSAVLDSIVALKGASKGVPNVLLRDLNAIHANTAPDDLPADVRAAIAASVRDAFGRLRKEGYIVSPANMAPPPAPK